MQQKALGAHATNWIIKLLFSQLCSDATYNPQNQYCKFKMWHQQQILQGSFPISQEVHGLTLTGW